jgi:hypothetical protein
VEAHPDGDVFLTDEIDASSARLSSGPRKASHFERMNSSWPIRESGEASMGARRASISVPASGETGGRVAK